MDDNFYDGTTRAGCRCENVVFVFFTGRIAAQVGLLFVLTGQKSGFSPRRGDSLHRFRSNFAVPTAPGSAWLCKITCQSVQRAGNGAPKYQKFPHLVKSRCDSLDRFPKCLGAFIRLTILRQCFEFHMIRITGYGVIAEKPCVCKLGQIFPCTLQEKLYVGSKNE